MLINFFLALRKYKVPVTKRESAVAAFAQKMTNQLDGNEDRLAAGVRISRKPSPSVASQWVNPLPWRNEP